MAGVRFALSALRLASATPRAASSMRNLSIVSSSLRMQDAYKVRSRKHSADCGGCRRCMSGNASKGTKATSSYGEMFERMHESGQEVGGGLFTSRFYDMERDEVVHTLKRQGVEFRDQGEHAVVKLCPLCHPIKNERDNMFKLYVKKENGKFICFRCNQKGNWWSLRSRLMDGSVIDSSLSSLATPAKARSDASGREGIKLSPPTAAAVPLPAEQITSARREFERNTMLRDYIRTQRGIDLAVADCYKVGGTRRRFLEGNEQWTDRLCLTFPMYNSSGEVVRMKLRGVENKSLQMLTPKGGGWGLFGLNTVPPDAKEVILTEGEFDAMAAYQMTGIPAVSLPNGANSLPVDVLPYLERFEKIYLWMDDDQAGNEGMSTFSRKLGMKRVVCVKTRNGATVGPKDANDALRAGVNGKALLERASKPSNQSIVAFSDLKEAIYEEYKNPAMVAGKQWESLPMLNDILMGHRRGEFSVFSGHTGVGKTTLLGQMSLDLCMRGVRTMWGSFEVSNVRLAKTLLGQFYFLKRGRYLRANDIKSYEAFEQICSEFEQLPLTFMRFFGSCPTQKVIDTMEYAHYVYDTSHFVLDNLQFMLSGQARGGRKFDLQDEAIIEMRKFATTKQCHISLVMHPRKENDEEMIQTSSISGTAKATQEADNVLLMQRGENFPFLEVRKNRFVGKLGKIPLAFDNESRVFTQVRTTGAEVRFDGNEFPKKKVPMDRPPWLKRSGFTQAQARSLLEQNRQRAESEMDEIVDLASKATDARKDKEMNMPAGSSKGSMDPQTAKGDIQEELAEHGSTRTMLNGAQE